MERRSLHTVPDAELLARLAELLRQSRSTESELVAHIAEVDGRKLYAREGSPSMFAYCTEALHLSEAKAYLRIAAARASREHPQLLEMLADGRLHLSGVGKLAPYLTHDNAAVLLARAAHKTKRQIEELIAQIAPRPDAPTVVRKLPERPPAAASGPASPLSSDGALPVSPSTGSGQAAPDSRGQPDQPTDQLTAGRQGLAVGETAGHELRPDAVAPLGAPTPRTAPVVLEPLAAGRYRVQFTASAALKHKLERLQALMRSQVSGGDLAAVIEAAVTEKLERLEAKRLARTSAPRKTLEDTTTAPITRHIPAAVRRVVQQRDGNRCRYVAAQGRQCSERVRLEFHHVYPFGHGGDHSPRNVALLCRAHNLLMAERDYGRPSTTRSQGSASDAGAHTSAHESG